MKIFYVLLSLMLVLNSPWIWASEIPEVFEDTRTRVLIREHPKTGQEYVSILSEDEPVPDDPLADGRGNYSRPDYRMLDHKIKKGSIPYDGPYSSKKKVYILAASLATLGTVGAVTMPIAATTGAASAGSALGPGIGVAVSGAATAAVAIKTQPKDLPEDYVRGSESRLLETENDFYRLHIQPKTSRVKPEMSP